MKQALELFLDHFGKLEDLREASKILYPVPEILLLTLCGVICGSDSWEDIEIYGESKLEVLQKFLPFKHGIPSDDTLRRFFRSINPDIFQQVFADFVRSLFPDACQNLIAVDGKTLRRSHDGAVKALHLVSAFASEARLVLAQTATDEKSNEITAIPELLRLLDLRGATISIDAMGCQKQIAKQIIDGGGNYLLAVKGNQKNLFEDIKLFFEKPAECDYNIEKHEENDKGHGRIERRICEATSDIDWLKSEHDWTGLASIARITSERTIKGKTSIETRYYIGSTLANPQTILQNTRAHWGIENCLHWVLDMCFGEDQCRIRKDNAPLAVATIRHVALNLLQKAKEKHPNKRISLKRLRKLAGWDNEILDFVLNPNKIIS